MAQGSPKRPRKSQNERFVQEWERFWSREETRAKPEQRGTGGAFARVAASKVVEVIRVQVKTGERNRLEANAIQRKRVHSNSVEVKPLQIGAMASA